MYTESYLAHHGIKGQKWGIRRYQNEDGSLTAAGEKRYRKEQKRQEHHEALVSSYTKLGYSKEIAERQATDHEKLEKAAKIGLVAVGVGLAAYGAYRLSDEYMDRTIKKGTYMFTVHHGSGIDRIKNAPFYMSWKKKDVNSYTSKVFGHLDEDSVRTKFTADKDIKMASSGSQRAAFKQLLRSDKSFSNYIHNEMNAPKTGGKSDFDRFTYWLVKRSDPDISKADKDNIDKFYNLLKKKGYSGVIDREDSIMEKWVKDPGIIFDSGSLKYGSTRKITEAEAKKRVPKAVVHLLSRHAALNTKGVLRGATIASALLSLPLSSAAQIDREYEKDKEKSKKET